MVDRAAITLNTTVARDYYGTYRVFLRGRQSGGSAGEVSVRLKDPETGSSATGRAADPDTLAASAKAYLSALNKLQVRKSRGQQLGMVDELDSAARRGP